MNKFKYEVAIHDCTFICPYEEVANALEEYAKEILLDEIKVEVDAEGKKFKNFELNGHQLVWMLNDYPFKKNEIFGWLDFIWHKKHTMPIRKLTIRYYIYEKLAKGEE